LFVVAIVLLGALAFGALNYFNSRGTGSNTNGTPNPTPTIQVSTSGIGVVKASNGQMIGISDGTFAFDTNRAGGALKQQAALKLKSGDTSGAVALWNQAVSKDTSDAESLIYLENQRVATTGNPYVTIVVGTMLTGDSSTINIGRDNLQGSYVAQKSFNDGSQLHHNVLVKLLIANSGSTAADTKQVAQQIVKLAQVDKTFVGVMGWPFSGNASIAISVLSPAHIPMISQTASSDSLTKASSYFYRVAPANQRQGVEGAKYAEQTLHASKAVLFSDPANPYTQSLADAFRTQFTADGNQIVAIPKVTLRISLNL
jgi:ABC-type branched-subunit amino acid transport system substrate-binding protein